jgi:uncharacterized protein YbjT (DUF2867 family)
LKAKVPASDIVALVPAIRPRPPIWACRSRAADYGSPAALEAALKGVDTLLLISSSEVGQRAVQHQNVINAAKAAGVGRIVYTSLLHADTSPLSLAAKHVRDRSGAEGLGHSAHHPAQWLVYRELYRLGSRGRGPWRAGRQCGEWPHFARLRVRIMPMRRSRC